MRLRLKSIREINSFIKHSQESIKIYVKNINDIEKLKQNLKILKLEEIKVILVYNGYQVDTGIEEVENNSVSFDDLNLLDGIVVK